VGSQIGRYGTLAGAGLESSCSEANSFAKASRGDESIIRSVFPSTM